MKTTLSLFFAFLITSHALSLTATASAGPGSVCEMIARTAVVSLEEVKQLFDSHCVEGLTVAPHETDLCFACEDFSVHDDLEPVVVSFFIDQNGLAVEREISFECSTAVFNAVYEDMKSYYRLVDSIGNVRFVFEHTIELVREEDACRIRIVK